jgi:uncharacterized protein HemY
MRTFIAILTSVLVLSFACARLATAQVSELSLSPSTWEPAYWDKMTAAIKDAQQRGDKVEAETLCSRAIPYAEAQAVKALAQYAELLEARTSDGAADARVRADKLAKVKADQARGNAPSSTYLGFAPAEELYVYVGALQVSGRDPEAQAMRLLAAAYRRSQEVYVRRSILMRERKDPRGEC